MWSVSTGRKGTQGPTSSRKIELPGREFPGAQQVQIRGTQAGEFGKQGLQRGACVPRAVAETIVGGEAEIGTFGENDASARDPIGLLTIDQMPHHVERTERIGTFGPSNPGRSHAVEQRPERGGGTLQDLYRQVEIEVHSLSQSPDRPAGG